MPDPKLGKLYDVFKSQTPELVQGMEKEAFITKFSNEEKLVKLYNELGKSPKTQPYLVGLDEASFVSKFKPEKDLGVVDNITNPVNKFYGNVGIGGAPLPTPKEKEEAEKGKVVEHHTALQKASSIIDDPKTDLTSKQEAFFMYAAEADKTYNKAKDYLVNNKGFDEQKYYSTIEKVSAYSTAMKQAKTPEEKEALKAAIQGDVSYLKELQTIPEFNAWTDAYKSLRTLEGKKKKLLPELLASERQAQQIQKETDALSKKTDIASDVESFNNTIFSSLAGSAGKLYDTVTSISNKAQALWDPKQAQADRVENLIEKEKRQSFLDAYKPTDLQGQYKEKYVTLLDGNKVILDDNNQPVYARDDKGFMVPLSKESKIEASNLATDEDKIQKQRNFKALGGMAIPVISDLAIQIALTKGLGGLGVTNSTMQVLIPTAVQSMGSYYYEALKEGKSDNEAFAISSAKAVLDGLLENIGGLESKLAGKGVSEGVLRAAKGDVRSKFLSGKVDSKQLLVEYLNYIKQRVPGSVGEGIKQGVGETVEEFAQGLEQGIIDNIGGADQDVIANTIKSAEETAILSFGVGAGTSMLSDMYNTRKDLGKSMLINAIDQMRSNRDASEKLIAESPITEDKKAMLIYQLYYIDNELSDKTFTKDTDRLEATHLAKVKMELEIKLEAAKEKGADKEVKKINEVLKDVKKGLDVYNTPEVEEAPVVEEVKVDDITDEEYNTFIDKGQVTEERLNDIAEKVKSKTELTDKETAIFTSKTGEINDIIAKATTPTENEVKNKEVLDKLLGDDEVGTSDPNFIEVTSLVDAIGTDSLFENDKGERGSIDIDTDGSVVLTTDKGETILGNTKDLGDATLEQFGLKQVKLQDNNNRTYSIGDSTYTIDNPTEAIEYETGGRKKGSVKSVTVTEFKDGKVQAKVITGPEAQELAYTIKLKELYERDGNTIAEEKITEYLGSQSDTTGDAVVGEDSNAGSDTRKDLPGTRYKSKEGVIYTIDSYTAKGHIKFQYQDRNGKTVKGVWDKDDFNSYVQEGSLSKTTETAAPVARKTNPFSIPAPTVKTQVTNTTLNTVKKEAPEKVAKLGRLALKKGDKVTVRDAKGKVVKRNVTVLEVSQDKRSVRTELGGKFASVPIDQIDHLDTKNIVAAVKQARTENNNPQLLAEADALVSGEPAVKLPEPPGSNITYKEYDNFKATGEIKETHLKSIASKVLANKELSRIEKEIYKGKKQEVDALVSDIKTKKEEAKQTSKEKKLSEVKQLEQEAEKLITKAVKESRPERAKLIADGKTEEQADDILQENWLKTPEGQQYTALETKIQELKTAEVKPVKEKTKEQLALEENQRQYEEQKNLPEGVKPPVVEVSTPSFVDQTVPVVEPEAAAEAKTKKDKVKVEAEARRIKETDGLKLTTNMLKQLAVAIKEGKVFPTVNKKVTGDNTNVDKGDVIKTKEGVVGVITDMSIERGNRTLHVRSSAGHVFTINTGLPVSGKGSSYEVIDVADFEYRDPTFFDIEYQVSAALAALRNIIPTINIQLLSNEEYISKFGQNERGKFERKAGVSTIYINKDTANEHTVFHEAAHAVFTHFFAVNDPRIFTFHQAIKEAISTSKDIDIQNLINKLDAHIALYKKDPTGVIPHEYLAELVGILAHNKETLVKPGLVDRMVDFVNDALEKIIGIRPLKVGSDINNIINIVNNIASNLATGKTIATDLEVLGTGDIELDYKQLIGPDGASNLDKEENTNRRMDALLVAMKFKDAAKTPKIIDTATGWIYTKTGWKYSIVNFDSKIRLEHQALNILKELTTSGYTVKLTDVIGAGEVFRAYPQLKDLNISVGVIAPNTLALSAEDIKDKNAAKTAIVYGIQRAIQRIEGIEDIDEANMVANQPDLVFAQKVNPVGTGVLRDVIKDKTGNPLLVHSGRIVKGEKFEDDPYLRVHNLGSNDYYGIYFTPNESEATAYSNKGSVMSGYIKSDKIFDFNNKMFEPMAIATSKGEQLTDDAKRYWDAHIKDGGEGPLQYVGKNLLKEILKDGHEVGIDFPLSLENGEKSEIVIFKNFNKVFIPLDTLSSTEQKPQEDVSLASKFQYSKEDILVNLGQLYATGKLNGTAKSLFKLTADKFKAKGITEEDIAIAIGEKIVAKTFVERVVEEAPYVPEENIIVEEELIESEREAEYTSFIENIKDNPKIPWEIKELLKNDASERVRLDREQLQELANIFIEKATTLPEIRKALTKVRRSLGYFSSIPKNSELAGRINGWQFIAMKELSERAYLLGDNKLSAQILNDIGDLAANMGRSIFTLAAMEEKSVASAVLISKLKKDYEKVDPLTGTSALDDMSAYIQSILPNDEETKQYLAAIEKKINNLLFNIEDVSFSSKTNDPKEQFIKQLLKTSTTRTTEATVLSKALSAHRRRLARLEKTDTPKKEKVDPIVKLTEDIKANRITIAELATVKKDIEAEVIKYPAEKRAELLNKIEDLMADITGHNIGSSALRAIIRNNAEALKKTLLQIAGDRVKSTTFKDTLLNQIKRETGLNDDEAKKYEKIIASTFKEMLEKQMAAKESVAKNKILNAKVDKAKEGVEKAKAVLEDYKKTATGTLASRIEGARLLKNNLAEAIKTYQKALAQKEHFLQRAKEPFSVLNSLRVGSIDTIEIANEFKDFYELSGITQNDLDKLNALSKELENATREADKLEAYKEFTLLLEDIVNSKSSKYWTSDTFYEYAYVGMLSSPLTVARAFGSAFKLFIESNFASDAILALGKSVVTMNPIHARIYAKGVADGAISFKNALPAAWQAMLKGIATEGVDPSEAGRLLGKGKLLSWKATQSWFTLLNNPKELKGKDAFFVPFYLAVFLGRGLIAMDILTKSFFHPYIENRLASYEVLKYTTEGSAVDFAKSVDELRGYVDNIEEEVAEDAKTHPEALALSGAKLEKWKRHRRHVLAREFTDKTIREASNDIAGELAMTGSVHGSIGSLINPLISRRQQHTEGAWARHLSFMALPFARVAGIGVNIITSALPTNLLQTKLNEKQEWTGGFQFRKTKRTYADSKKLERERDLLTYELVNMTVKALAPSVAFIAALMYMFDFEKEKDKETGEEYYVVKLGDSNLRITGGDNSSRIKNRTTKGDGWEPYSIQWLDKETNKWHTKYMYLDGLFGAMLSPLGTLSDNLRSNPDFGKTTTKADAIGDLLTGLQSYVLNFGWGSGFTTITNMIDIISATVEGKDKEIAYDNLVSTTVRPAVPMLGLASFVNKFGEYYLDKDKVDRGGANAATDALRGIPLIGRTVKGLTSAFSVMPGLNTIDYLYPYVDVDPIGYPVVDRLNVGVLPFGAQEFVNNEPETKVPRVWKVLRKYPESFGFHHFYVNDRVKDFEDVLTSPSLTFKAQVKQKAAETKRRVLEDIAPSLESFTEGPYDPDKAKSLLKTNTSINDDVNEHVLVEHLLEVEPKLRAEASNFTKTSDLNLLGNGKSYDWDKVSKYLLANNLVIENDVLTSKAERRSSVPLKVQDKDTRKVKKIIRKGG